MLEQLFEDGEKFELKGVEFTILSVGRHEPGGFSYAFRPTSDIKKDAKLTQKLEDERMAELAKEEEERAAAEAEAEDAKENEQTEGGE